MEKSLREAVTYPLYIPAKINVDEILKTYPPTKRGITRDNLLYIIDLIFTRSLRYNTDYFKGKRNGYVPLKANYLRLVLPQYSNCIRYLEERGIVECDYQHIVGVTSYGYRIQNHLYGDEYKKEYFNHSKLYFKLDRLKGYRLSKRRALEEKRYYLFTPYYNKSITIDYEEALNCLNSLVDEKRHLLYKNQLIPEEKKVEKENDIEALYHLQKMKLRRIINNDYRGALIIDNTSQRFHTPITSLKRELREFIRIDDEELVGIDIKNSQPFFFLQFFSREFWQEGKRGEGRVRLTNIDNIYWRYLKERLPMVIPYTIPKSGKTLENTDISVNEFCTLVRNGRLYDYLRVLQKVCQ